MHTVDTAEGTGMSDSTWYDIAYAKGRMDATVAAVQRVETLKPRLWMTTFEGGYDCCGCSTLMDLYDDALAAIKGDSNE